MNITLLIIHGLLAVMLLGAITHQSFNTVWPRRPGESNFIARYRGVNGAGYTNAVIVLFVLTFSLGSYIYVVYRIEVRPPLEVLFDLPAIGIFELKEHFLVIALGMLPAYWFFWKKKPENRLARTMITMVLAATVWFSFIVGHYVNNVRGFI